MSPSDDLRECHDCGLFQRTPPADAARAASARAEGAALSCGRCGATLRRGGRRSNAASLACAVLAATFLGFGLVLPLLDLHAAGRFQRAAALDGPRILAERGDGALSAVIVATLFMAPAIQIAVHVVALVAAFVASPASRVRRPAAWLFGLSERVAPWAMVDVFLVGVFIAYTRLGDWAQTDLGPATLGLACAAAAMTAAGALLDRDRLWRALATPGAPRVAERLHRPRAGGEWIGCGACGLVGVRADGARCRRCAHPLHARKPNGLSRAWAMTIGAALLYIPANVLPVMDYRRLGRGAPSTILQGVRELALAHLWPLAIVVLLASFVVPMLKLGVVVTMLVSTRRRSSAGLRARTRWFRFVRVIGRWSMIDIFVLATLAAAVNMGFLAVVLPGDGALAFCGVVVLTLCATELFDPRVMWDAAGANGDERTLMEGDAPPAPALDLA